MRPISLDEPLGSLDRRLREELTDELATQLRAIGTTALYVTHDQEEAALVSDRMLILEQGRVAAYGTAETLWNAPATPWIARFMGHTNVSDEGVVPIQAIRFDPGASHQRVGEVIMERFVDGVWRLRLAIHEPVVGLAQLNAVSTVRHEVGDRVTLTLDEPAIHRFPPNP